MTRPDTTPAPTPVGVEDLQLEIVTTLAELLELVPLVAALVDSHQAGVGFMSYDARQVENAMTRKERRLQIEAAILGRPLGHGATAAPGNLGALSVYAEIWAASHQAVDRLVKHLGLIPRHLEIPNDGGTPVQLLRMLRPLVWEVENRTVLTKVRDDLAHVESTAKRVIDGPDSAYYPDAPCPHCGRPSLRATFSEGVVETVTCDKDQSTGERHACVCSDPICECKERPIAHRHTWHRTRGNKPDGLLTLSGRLKLTRTATQKGPAQ